MTAAGGCRAVGCSGVCMASLPSPSCWVSALSKGDPWVRVQGEVKGALRVRREFFYFWDLGTMTCDQEPWICFASE